MSKPRLVIIGAGYAGLTLAQATASFLDVTLIDRKDFFEFNVANVRSVVDTSYIDKTQFLYSNLKGVGTFVHGSVARLEQDQVVLEDGRTFPFDYAAIATGSLYGDSLGKAPPAVTTLAQRKEELLALHDRIQSAAHVLVVGGGATGVELAAEVVEAYPGKQVTLVHAGSRLLNKTEPIAKWSRQFLESKGATVILEDKVTQVPGSPTEFVTASGKSITAQVVVWAVAGRPDTGFLQEVAPQLLNERGEVKVDEQLRVEGLGGRVFCVGDATSLGDKVIMNAKESAALVARNLKAIVSAAPGSPQPPKLTAWKPNNNMGALGAGVVALGPNAGTGHIGSFTVPSLLVTWLKSRDLFVSKLPYMLPALTAK